MKIFKRSHKQLTKNILAHSQESIAKFLTKFGTLGKKIRAELVYYLWSNTLLFKK